MKYLFLLVVFIVAVSCVDKKTSVTEVAETVEVNDKSVAYKKVPIVTFDGLQPLLFKNNDSTYVVNFWATWCKPCIKEMPYFEKINSDYAKDKVKVVFVSLDFPDKLESQVIPFLEKNNIQSQVVLLDDADANSWIPKVSKEWSGAIPATIIYKNATRKFYERSFIYEELENELKTIL